MSDIYQFNVKDINGNEQSLEQYRGKLLLIVNVASKCGFTPQYEGLEQIYREYKNRDFEILAFPCNQFGGQEPEEESKIKEFCELNYQVSFPLFAKVDVNGDGAIPLYDYLKSEAKGLLGSKSIKWNFTKFLVSKEGKVIDRYAPKVIPKELEKVIKDHL